MPQSLRRGHIPGPTGWHISAGRRTTVEHQQRLLPVALHRPRTRRGTTWRSRRIRNRSRTNRLRFLAVCCPTDPSTRHQTGAGLVRRDRGRSSPLCRSQPRPRNGAPVTSPPRPQASHYSGSHGGTGRSCWAECQRPRLREHCLQLGWTQQDHVAVNADMIAKWFQALPLERGNGKQRGSP